MRDKRKDIPFPDNGLDETADAHLFGPRTTPSAMNVISRRSISGGRDQGSRPGLEDDSVKGTIEAMLPIQQASAGDMTTQVAIVVGGVVSLL